MSKRHWANLYRNPYAADCEFEFIIKCFASEELQLQNRSVNGLVFMHSFFVDNEHRRIEDLWLDSFIPGEE